MKFIKDYEGLYSVSELGDIYSHKSEKLLKQETSNAGYKRVRLYKNGVSKKASVHRLVAEAFIDNFSEKPVVNHRDGNKLNNTIDNLEWCTQSYNVKHSWENGTSKTTPLFIETSRKKGKRMGESIRKIPIDDASEILEALEYTDLKQIDVAKHYGVSRSAIANMVRRSK